MSGVRGGGEAHPDDCPITRASHVGWSGLELGGETHVCFHVFGDLDFVPGQPEPEDAGLWCFLGSTAGTVRPHEDVLVFIALDPSGVSAPLPSRVAVLTLLLRHSIGLRRSCPCRRGLSLWSTRAPFRVCPAAPRKTPRAPESACEPSGLLAMVFGHALAVSLLPLRVTSTGSDFSGAVQTGQHLKTGHLRGPETETPLFSGKRY